MRPKNEWIMRNKCIDGTSLTVCGSKIFGADTFSGPLLSGKAHFN